MDKEKDKVAIIVRVSPEIGAKIEELADRMGASQSKMATMLLEEGLADNEWIIRFVTSKVVKGLRESLGRIGPQASAKRVRKAKPS
jgi:predicted transcriptional regulator